MTDVRVRHESDEHPVSIGEVPLMEVDTIVPLMSRWGITIKGGGVSYSGGEISGQFVLDPESAAYFEVQLHDE